MSIIEKIEELMQRKSNIDDVYKFSIDVYNVNEELQHDTTLNFSEKMAIVDKFNKHYEDTNLKKMHVYCGIDEWQHSFGKNNVSNRDLENIKVSIQVPVYNKEKFGLSRALDSLINQTHKNLEIICVNDASTDNSLEIIQEYSKKDNRIVVVDLKENRKCSGARIAGWEVATGDYITAVDPDDWVDNDYIEQMLLNIVKLNVEVLEVFSLKQNKEDKLYYGVTGEILFLSTSWSHNKIGLSICGKIYKNNVIAQSLDELKRLSSINMADDVMLNAIILEKVITVAVINLSFKYHYEPNSVSITRCKDFNKMMNDIIYANSIVKSRYNNFFTEQHLYSHLDHFVGIDFFKFGLHSENFNLEKDLFLKLDKDLLATTLVFTYQYLNQARQELSPIKKYKFDKIVYFFEKLLPINSLQRNFIKKLFYMLKNVLCFIKKSIKKLNLDRDIPC